MASVSFQRVSKEFPAKPTPVRAVDDLSLDVHDRELMVLVGPSGSGKTTVLRLIAGLEEVSSGTIRIGDRDVNRVEPKHRDVAMVFQNYALYPHMTVYKNLAFGLKMRRTPKVEIQRRVTETAQMLGIDHLLDRKPGALSGGECQRVAVGRAIVRTPKVFLFDEPLSNLDASLRLQVRMELKSLHQNLQTTTLYVTHDQAEAMTLGDRIAVMRAGVIQQVGPPLDVYRRPVNRFVAGFIGSPPMNFLTARWADEGGSRSLRGAWGRLTPTAEDGASLRCDNGMEITVGVRPEHVRIVEDGADPARRGAARPDAAWGSLGAMTVSMIEPLGDCVHVHLSGSSGDTMIARTPAGDSIHTGDRVRVSVDCTALHLFDAGETGRRLN